MELLGQGVPGMQTDTRPGYDVLVQTLCNSHSQGIAYLSLQKTSAYNMRTPPGCTAGVYVCVCIHIRINTRIYVYICL